MKLLCLWCWWLTGNWMLVSIWIIFTFIRINQSSKEPILIPHRWWKQLLIWYILLKRRGWGSDDSMDGWPGERIGFLLMSLGLLLATLYFLRYFFRFNESFNFRPLFLHPSYPLPYFLHLSFDLPYFFHRSFDLLPYFLHPSYRLPYFLHPSFDLPSYLRASFSLNKLVSVWFNILLVRDNFWVLRF